MRLCQQVGSDYLFTSSLWGPHRLSQDVQECETSSWAKASETWARSLRSGLEEVAFRDIIIQGCEYAGLLNAGLNYFLRPCLVSSTCFFTACLPGSGTYMYNRRSRAAQRKTVDSFTKNIQHMAWVALGNVSLSKTGLIHLTVRDRSLFSANVMHFAGVLRMWHHQQAIRCTFCTVHERSVALLLSLNITHYSEGFVAITHTLFCISWGRINTNTYYMSMHFRAWFFFFISANSGIRNVGYLSVMLTYSHPSILLLLYSTD